MGEKKLDSGELVLSIPRKKAWWMGVLSRIFYIPEEKQVCLDEIGSWVWHRCDGRTNVGRLIEELGKAYKINRREAEVSLLSYLKKLGEKKLIGFLVN